jgi:outer membrane protein OmpU
MGFELKEMRKAMKKYLFATTAIAGLAIGGMASAQGITLFGDARLGIGYGINNDGSLATNLSVDEVPVLDDDGNPVLDADGEPLFDEVLVSEPDEELRAISRVRFGVRMTGETDTGITFGASIRADNSGNGQGSTFGQRAGDVFVSGAFGTLTYGDTAGADERNVGDVPGGVGITGLGDFNETFYFTNGGEVGVEDSGFEAKPNARPTVRYDYAFQGINLSASTDRDLADVAVGASYTFDFDAGSVTAGIGYAQVAEFLAFGGAQTVVVDGVPVQVLERALIPEVEQFSASLQGTFGGFTLGGVYTTAETDTIDSVLNPGERVKGELDTWLIGAEYGWNEWTFGGFYHKVQKAGGTTIEALDGNDVYGVGFSYDLGGGAAFRAGYVNDLDDQDRADVGITMAF